MSHRAPSTHPARLTGVLERDRERVFLVLHHVVLHLLVPPVRVLVGLRAGRVRDAVPQIARVAPDDHVGLDAVDELGAHHGLAENERLLGDVASQGRQQLRRVRGVRPAQLSKARVHEKLQIA